MTQSRQQQKAMFRRLQMRANTLVNVLDYDTESISLDRDLADAKIHKNFPKSTFIERTKALRIAEMKKFGE